LILGDGISPRVSLCVAIAPRPRASACLALLEAIQCTPAPALLLAVRRGSRRWPRWRAGLRPAGHGPGVVVLPGGWQLTIPYESQGMGAGSGLPLTALELRAPCGRQLACLCHVRRLFPSPAAPTPNQGSWCPDHFPGVKSNASFSHARACPQKHPTIKGILGHGWQLMP